MILKGERDIHNHFQKWLNQREEILVDEIWTNMVNRGFLIGEEEGMEKSELYLLALKIKKITIEEISDKLLNQSMEM
jgi:hypothetical protein